FAFSARKVGRMASYKTDVPVSERQEMASHFERRRKVIDPDVETPRAGHAGRNSDVWRTGCGEFGMDRRGFGQRRRQDDAIDAGLNEMTRGLGLFGKFLRLAGFHDQM